MAKDSKSKFDNQKYERIEIGSRGNEVGFTEGESGVNVLDGDGNIIRKTFFNFSATDGIANQAEAVISFRHVSSGQDVYFKAFITSFSDSISPSFGEETVFGRTDPIYTFKNATRSITLNWKVPAETFSEAYENLGKAQTLAKFAYPSYTNLQDIDNALTLSQTPLVRLKVMNLLTKTSSGPPDAENSADGSSNEQKFSGYRSSSDSTQGALGALKSITILHNLENFDAGVLYAGPNTVLPKLIEINVSFDVIHEETLGWVGSNFNRKAAGFPYNIIEQDEIDVDALNQKTNFNKEVFNRNLEDTNREEREQAQANARARYGTMGGKARMKKDLKRIERLEGKDNLNANQQAKLDYLNSCRQGQQLNNPETADVADPDLIGS